MSYADLLRDPRWQRMRLEVMQRAGFACERCHSTTKTLNVHHTYYSKGRPPWQYPSESLRCLCEECHRIQHGLATKGPESIASILPRALEPLGYEVDTSLCVECQASFPVGADELCAQCHHIVNGTVADWQIELPVAPVPSPSEMVAVAHHD